MQYYLVVGLKSDSRFELIRKFYTRNNIKYLVKSIDVRITKSHMFNRRTLRLGDWRFRIVTCTSCIADPYFDLKYINNVLFIKKILYIFGTSTIGIGSNNIFPNESTYGDSIERV